MGNLEAVITGEALAIKKPSTIEHRFSAATCIFRDKASVGTSSELLVIDRGWEQTNQ
jgi:hypothetical protein